MLHLLLGGSEENSKTGNSLLSDGVENTEESGSYSRKIPKPRAFTTKNKVARVKTGVGEILQRYCVTAAVDTESFERKKETLEVVVEVGLDFITPISNVTFNLVFEFSDR